MERSLFFFLENAIAERSISVCSWMPCRPGRKPFCSADTHSSSVAVNTRRDAMTPERSLYSVDSREIGRKFERSAVSPSCRGILFWQTARQLECQCATQLRTGFPEDGTVDQVVEHRCTQSRHVLVRCWLPVSASVKSLTCSGEIQDGP